MKESTIQRIRDLTAIDMSKKTAFEILASAIEELGEFSRELKIEERTFGNTYKKPDEGTQCEAVDSLIMGFCLFFCRGGDRALLDEIINKKLDKWESSQAESLRTEFFS